MALGISKKLNYNLYSNKERAEQVKELFNEEVSKKARLQFEEQSTQKELETIANFILYGKDPANDKNFCQKKEIHIDQAKSSYKRKEPESLDELIDNPLVNENSFQPIKKSPYKKIKPTIDREKDKDIPGMQDLWKIIDSLAAQVKKLKDNKPLNLDYYKKNHALISLRKEQFALKDSIVEQIKGKKLSFFKTHKIYDCDTGYLVDYAQEAIYCFWRANHYKEHFSKEWYEKEIQKAKQYEEKGKNGEWEYREVSENEIDFTNPKHVYNVLEMYSTLKAISYDDLESNIKYILWELEDYIEKAKLSEVRKYILIRKIDKATNDRIREEIVEKFGMGYSDNYISTIYKQIICKKIAEAAQTSKEEFLYRNQPEKFKICSTCGRKLLRDKRNFTKKPNSKDGLSARCKECDKEIRERKKKEKLKQQ